MQAELNLLNGTRAQAGVDPLTLNMGNSLGTGSCIGALGHSKHMAQVGQISHDQFPADICTAWSTAGENVGEWKTGNELQDLETIHSEMMSEPHSSGCSGNHACNIISPAFHIVGIGIYYSNGTTWLTTDFTG
jgi:uncharacterized protein YkwD